jgi:hypothetical protein
MNFDADIPTDAQGVAEKSGRPLSGRDRTAALALASAGKLIGRLVADDELAELMKTQGYDQAEFQNGVTLQTAAEEVFQTCRRAQVALYRMQLEYALRWEDAREEYIDFRWAARNAFPDEEARRVLVVHETVSPELQAFLSQAAVSYRAAQSEEIAGRMQEAGFGADQVGVALANLRRLARLDLALQASQNHAARCLDERELALAMVNLWIRDFYRAARCVLGERWRPPAAPAVARDRRPRNAPVKRPVERPGDPARFIWRMPPGRL